MSTPATLERVAWLSAQLAAHADDAYRAENADAVPYWLLTFLNDTPLE